MAKSDNIKEEVNQTAVQVAMMVILVLRDTERGPWPTTAESHREPHRYRYSGLVFAKIAFNWGMKDRYVELKL